MERDLKNDVEDSFIKFSQGRKSRQNTRVIADTVYARLRDAILSAELRPNQRLVEDELADWLSVSRTPIREALLSLQKEGLVERDRGWIVREHSPAAIQARLECRLAIEGYATRLAAMRRSEADLQELRALADKMEKPDSPHLEIKKLNSRFHRIITEAAHNPALLNLHDQTKLNDGDLSVPVVFSPDAEQKIHTQHRALIDALASQDADRAESIARAHIQLTIDIVLEAPGVV